VTDRSPLRAAARRDRISRAETGRVRFHGGEFPGQDSLDLSNFLVQIREYGLACLELGGKLYVVGLASEART